MWNYWSHKISQTVLWLIKIIQQLQAVWSTVIWGTFSRITQGGVNVSGHYFLQCVAFYHSANSIVKGTIHHMDMWIQIRISVWMETMWTQLKWCYAPYMERAFNMMAGFQKPTQLMPYSVTLPLLSLLLLTLAHFGSELLFHRFVAVESQCSVTKLLWLEKPKSQGSDLCVLNWGPNQTPKQCVLVSFQLW